MKRVIAVLLCLSIILTGCQSGRKKVKEKEDTFSENVREDKGSKEEGSKDTREGKQEGSTSGARLLNLSSKWTKVSTAEATKPEFAIPEYKANVAPYKIAKDLSNIENINQFSGFTDEQIKSLVENGFVVLPTRTTKMHYTYDTNEYQGIPNFITTDSVLHVYHQFYDKSLTNIEGAYLYQDLDQLSLQMLKNSLLLWDVLEDAKLKSLQERNIIYYLIARMLITDQADSRAIYPSDSPVQASSLSAEIFKLADSEYALIKEAGGSAKSPYLNSVFDYSQFTVRGHYTRSEELGRFFRTMMWFGTAPLSLMVEKDFKYENTIQSLLMTYATFMEEEGRCPAELWTRIYQPTAQYVGLSDDVDCFTMNQLRIAVFGDTEDPNLFMNQKYYDRLRQAVEELPNPMIQKNHNFSDPPSEKQFRYMGQRYILDSFVMQNLIDPIARPIPSALDVMGVLGSDTAEQLLFEHYKPQVQWPKYTEYYRKLKEEVSDYGLDIWNRNLYNGWIWAIQEALTEYGYDSGMPYFMTTKAWKYKSLNTALGSYTELKHDTILYGKQASAEGGGEIVTAEYHYVEPNVALYGKLLYLTDQTIKVLEEQGMMNESLAEGARLYKELLELLIVCSIKELNNELLTEEEYRNLLAYGGKLEWISTLLLDGASDADSLSMDITDMLVTDIASYAGAYLSLGTGFFDDIYVVIPVDGKLYLSRGSVYSHYEFTSNKRLTDEEWWAMQGLTVRHEEYADYVQYTEPSKQLPDQPFWTGNFKSDSNDVEITSLEVLWENMIE
jgi:hypothetical protein